MGFIGCATKIEHNVLGIAEGRCLEVQCFNPTQMPNRSKRLINRECPAFGNTLLGAVLLTNFEYMFKDFKEFKQFMIFCHTHYELNDVWHFENGDKGILFEGAWNNSGGNQKYSPFNLPEEQQPQYAKRNSLEEVYEVWQKVRSNIVK